MENYDKLKYIIQAANPEIMELKFGCEVKSHYSIPSWITKILPNEDEYGQWVSVTDGFKDRDIQIAPSQILGRPIRLADVLLACGNKITLDYIINGNWLELIDYDDDEPKTVFMWNLKDDNLDHQSDETKQFLIDLLV